MLEKNPKKQDFLKFLFKKPDEFTAKDVEEVRKIYKEYLDKQEKEGSEVKIEEIIHLYSQFCNFVTLHLLGMFVQHVLEDEQGTDKFINTLINNFLAQIKTNIYRGFELAELKQEDTVLSKIMGNDLLSQETKLNRERMAKLFDTFKSQIQNTLNLNKKSKLDLGEGLSPDDIN